MTPYAKTHEFPPRFLHVHRDLMQQTYYSCGDTFQIKAHFTHSVKDSMSADPNLIVGVKANDTPQGVVFGPFGYEDVLMADRWEEQFKGLPDDAIELLRKAVTPT